MTKFNRCPNPYCNEKPKGGLFGGGFMKIYECKNCGTLYCYKCGDTRCPECGSIERSVAGKCYA